MRGVNPTLRCGIVIALHASRAPLCFAFRPFTRTGAGAVVVKTVLMSSKGATTDDITTVVGITAAEDTIKKSRFIGYCCAAPTFADGMALLDIVKGDHPKARHVCWAWQGVKTESRYNDDGEPSGTAGQPILASIQGEGLSQTFVAVVRYFGGVLLGTGGLVRAKATIVGE
eukprot:TRINITY_DN4496_c0_g1_i4.p3 TRINITY_DN4496_c0_g1~~TRINITY_DN4496_c0_g1_i4.p3  ORF type:complete len:171 (+),score=43.94 TRINITY_DN4496_c0_g1_i4:48-560(+)